MEADRFTVPVDTLFHPGTVTVRATTTLRGAAMVLADECTGTALVVDATGVNGIVSERDLVGGLADGCDPDQDRVQQVMTDQLATVDAGATAGDALALMAAHDIRHLVVTRAGEPVGVISNRDLLKLAASRLVAG